MLFKLHYNGVNIYLLTVLKFKAKDSESNAAPLYIGSVSKDFQ